MERACVHSKLVTLLDWAPFCVFHTDLPRDHVHAFTSKMFVFFPIGLTKEIKLPAAAGLQV